MKSINMFAAGMSATALLFGAIAHDGEWMVIFGVVLVANFAMAVLLRSLR